MPGGVGGVASRDVPLSRSLTHSGRWMFGLIFGLDGQESYRELRLELVYCLTV